ncbi:protein MpBAH1 [Marchantia polymorpha subsp. ruderalis]|uniref:BAH domain-containing protein n=2 Tax=Marchantia polymorpha TaxID=3197 RepID=A0AAF6BAF2_MARPO|nr:hypothetical protein MARPO_0054s0081 [Marchantia polymorpha]BBN08986.1 hypothetical protein Mp_4g16160 [Marchantia polymorpha subsp. ruderalis]|eukprot:PTQ37973.1 hypothetical protein MARPO_0054s0081 [Marchantia polymorpha]
MDGGRKLSVGDCALFQAGNGPPFIGILRKVTQEKDTTKLVVNWLYRPADVKLAKGVPLEAAPNEIFYSFHKDEISAASLLHPCKVAFLRKGAELPPGVSSFVCRRVYDTANKCLWWLTDRDYTNEHQDEVDQLLERTKLEMQAVVQSGGPSPRSLTGPTSSQQQQLKASSEVAQNVTFAVSNKGKKKRERADQTLEPSKRERSLKAEDGESSPLKRERSMKPEEVASITDKDGGLQNPSSVERLVQLMQQDHNDGIRKAADVAARRAMFAGVVAATERDDCLSRFVQLGGLPILDDWLQEAHKGKVGDGGSPKEGDKGVEELLLTLLRALDKLPVDLDGLKTCSVGKSVNHLRSHKNPEIQKKARKLVEIWKKRVDAEMKLSGEGKSASNHALWNSYKQSSPDVVHSHLMKGGPTEVAVKSSGASAGSAKAMPNGVGASGFADGMAKPSASPFAPSSKPSSASPAVVKKEDAGAKLSTGSAPADAPAGGLAVKDEKSTSSQSQSQSNGQMWAGVAPGGKGGASSAWKEDSKSSSLLGAVSSKPAGSVARHPSLPGKGLLGVASGAQKDHLGGKPLIWSRSATDKSATSTVAAPEKGRDGGSDGGARDSPGGSQHRLIVRIPNPGRSPARMNSGSFDLSTPVSRGLSPSVPERSAPPNGDCSDAKSRLQNGNQSAGATADGCAEGLRMGSVADDDRDNYPGSAPSEPPGESEKRGDEADRSSKEAPDANGGSGGFAPRGGAMEAEDVKKGEAASSQAPGAPTADASASGATAMEVDDQGISLLASVAASEINRGVPSSSSSLERSQADDCNGEQDHGARLSSDGGASLLKEAGDKQQQQQQQQHQHQHQQQLTGNEDGDGKDSSEVAGAPVSSTVNPSKNRDDSGVEHNADSNGGKAGDAASNEEALQESTSGSAEGDTEDVEKRHFSVQEPGRVLDASGNTKTSLDRKGEERHMDESGSKAALAPCEPLPYSSDGNPSALSGADGLGCNQDGHGVVSSGKKDSHDEKKSSALGKSSLSGIELNVAYGSGGHDFKDSSEKDEEMKSSVESGGQSFGRRGNDNDGHKVSDMCTSFPEEEVLEVARQAAKEVEQMERWKDSKSGVMSGGDKEGQDVNSPGFKSSDPRDSGFSDTGREHRWKPHSSIEKVKDDDSRKRSGPYLEDNHDSVAERMDEGSVRSTAIGEADDDQARCGGGSGDRKLANSGQDGGGESALEGGQEHKRRAIDGRAPIRVPSFHSSQMLSIPNLPTLTSTTVNVQNVVKPSPRSLPAGEPTTPEQATETTGPNDGAVGGSDVSERPDFDLNEGFSVEESPQDDSTTSPIAPVAVVAALSSSATLQANGAAAPIAIVTATKGPFVLPASPMRTKSELGWKGSAATSAFRPAEPRRTPERQPEIIVPEPVQQMEVVKKVRPPLNIDLNIADDRGFEEVGMSAPTTTTTMSSQGSAVGMSSQAAPVPSMSISGITYHSEQSTSGPQAQMGGNFGARPILDLNLIDESEESGTLLETDPMLPEAMGSSTRSNNSSSSQVNCRVMRDFDLNDGPSVEEPVVDEQPVMSSLRGGPRLTTAPFIAVPAPGPGLRRGAEVVNVAAPWFANTAYPAVAIPAFSNRDPTYSVAAAAAAQSYLSAGQGPAPFSSDMYRGTAGLPSASGVAFPSSTQSYPYGTFPLPSGFGFTSAASFAANNAAPYMEPPGSSSFPVASSGVVPSSFARPPFLIPNIADMGPSDSSGGSGGWGARPSLDLNAGPEAADADGGRDDGMNMRHRHETSMLSGQVSLEQLRSYRVSPTAGSVGAQLPKRKEPDGGWDLYRSSGFKQQAWR